MDGFKLILIVYISYLLIDGILRFIKILFIFTEFGLIITIKSIMNFIRAIYLKLVKKSGPDLNVIDFYMPGGIAFIDKPINPDILSTPMGRVRIFLRTIVKPTILIEYCGSGIAMLCAIEKGDGILSTKEEFDSAVINSLLKLGFASSYYYGPRITRNLPLLTNLIRVIEYHWLLITEAFALQKDIYGTTAISKIARLLVTYIILYLIFLRV